MILNNENCNPCNWIIKIAPILSYKAIPSIFIVAPIGTINLDILEGIPILSKHDIVTGTVAVLNDC